MPVHRFAIQKSDLQFSSSSGRKRGAKPSTRMFQALTWRESHPPSPLPHRNTQDRTTSLPPNSGCNKTLASQNWSSFRRLSRKAGRKRARAAFGGREGSDGRRECWIRNGCQGWNGEWTKEKELTNRKTSLQRIIQLFERWITFQNMHFRSLHTSPPTASQIKCLQQTSSNTNIPPSSESHNHKQHKLPIHSFFLPHLPPSSNPQHEHPEQKQGQVRGPYYQTDKYQLTTLIEV